MESKFSSQPSSVQSAATQQQAFQVSHHINSFVSKINFETTKFEERLSQQSIVLPCTDKMMLFTPNSKQKDPENQVQGNVMPAAGFFRREGVSSYLPDACATEDSDQSSFMSDTSSVFRDDTDICRVWSRPKSKSQEQSNSTQNTPQQANVSRFTARSPAASRLSSGEPPCPRLYGAVKASQPLSFASPSVLIPRQGRYNFSSPSLDAEVALYSKYTEIGQRYRRNSFRGREGLLNPLSILLKDDDSFIEDEKTMVFTEEDTMLLDESKDMMTFGEWIRRFSP